MIGPLLWGSAIAHGAIATGGLYLLWSMGHVPTRRGRVIPTDDRAIALDEVADAAAGLLRVTVAISAFGAAAMAVALARCAP